MVDRSTSHLDFARHDPAAAVPALATTQHNPARTVLDVHDAKVLAPATAAHQADLLTTVRLGLALHTRH
jgi:hypothetical protein